jgi:LPLT family lysophospholipid transporter-like MFS transporter
MGLVMSVNNQPRSKHARRKFIPAGLWSRGMFATLGGPLLQAFFVGAYILLAPFVGVFADVRPKGRVMLYANTVKFVGALGMCLHVNPFFSYALVGAGAAANSPAKYGILGELVAPAQLVKANSLLEASTIAAILLGAIGGGTLTDWSIEGALIAITGCYAAAALSAILVPRIRQRAVSTISHSVISIVKSFALRTHSLLKSPNARLAVIGTSLFWGAGAALRFLVIAWVPVALKVSNNRLPGFLTGMVAAGIVIGAALAARFVRLQRVHRALPAGILIGVGVCLLPLVTTQTFAFVVMAFVGICSGFFVIPLDALLQREGESSVGAGSAIAIQNMFENLSMLALVSGYSAAVFLSAPVNDIAVGVGAFIALSMATLVLTRLKAAKAAW